MNEAMDELMRVPEAWAHTHKYDTSDREFEARMVRACTTCRDRQEDAIAEGRVCESHPGALYEEATAASPAWCEVCEDEQKVLDARAQRYIERTQLDEIRSGQAPLPAHLVALARQAYIDGARENRRAS